MKSKRLKLKAWAVVEKDEMAVEVYKTKQRALLNYHPYDGLFHKKIIPVLITEIIPKKR